MANPPMGRRSIVALALLIPLSACGTPEPSATVTVTEPPPAGQTEGEPTATSTPSIEGEPGAQTVKFGQTVKGASGGTLTLGAPKKVTPTYELDDKPDEWVALDVTFLNDTKKPVNAAEIGFRATSGDKECPTLTDKDLGIDAFPTSVILPGKTLTWRVGFGRSKGREFIVTVDLNYEVLGYYST